jgi:hypothetical protein
MAQIQVNVSWREIPIFEGILLSKVEGITAFLRTKTPMPVGTMLIVSPCEQPEACVPARVTSVAEVVEAGSDASQGMVVTFEAAAELLEPFLADEPQPVVGLAPEPAFETAMPDEDEEEPGREKPRLEVVSVDEEDLPAAPRVSVVEEVKDSGITPQVSGEISLEGTNNVAGDPDSPDKVIIDVEAGLPPQVAEPSRLQSFERDALEGESGAAEAVEGDAPEAVEAAPQQEEPEPDAQEAVEAAPHQEEPEPEAEEADASEPAEEPKRKKRGRKRRKKK